MVLANPIPALRSRNTCATHPETPRRHRTATSQKSPTTREPYSVNGSRTTAPPPANFRPPAPPPPAAQTWFALRDYLRTPSHLLAASVRLSLKQEPYAVCSNASSDLQATPTPGLADYLHTLPGILSRQKELNLSKRDTQSSRTVSPDFEAAAQRLATGDKLTSDLPTNWNLSSSVSVEDSEREKLAYQPTHHGAPTINGLSSSGSRYGTGSTHWQKFADRLWRSLESPRELNINPT